MSPDVPADGTTPAGLQTTWEHSWASSRLVLSGTFTGALPADDLRQLAEKARQGCSVVLDCSQLAEISHAGLRALLVYCRHVSALGGELVQVGVPAVLRSLTEAAGYADLYRRACATPQVHGQSVGDRWPVNAYPTHEHAGYRLRAGHPLPLGATLVGRGINFSVYSRHAESCTLVLFHPGTETILAELPYQADFRFGDIFSMTVFDLDPEETEYGFRFDGPWDPRRGHRFDASRVLLDPTARAVAGSEVWGHSRSTQTALTYRARLIDEDFDWEGDRPLSLPLEKLVIYELHVRGFTQSPTSQVHFPGTFAGLREKIPYLKQLGVNAVELMPVFEFNELENLRSNPVTGERLWNYWGYNTVAFYAPNSSYAASGRLGLQGAEFKTLVKELHRAGIEVILDVVFNHTAEGDEHGPTFSFRGIDNRTYYLLTPDGHYFNFSGCGNTLNCNHPVVREWVVDCLRYWAAEYHIDGFRFDLASILGRDQRGEPLSNPPLLESLAADLVLGRTKLIAEAWDAAGLYQVGSFPDYARWSEWNGRYRDCLRKFVRGDFDVSGEMATRVVGSTDLYAGRGSSSSINFVTCHDGFTLADLWSYNHKHNEANGERGQDGAHENLSWNCGVEGPSDAPPVAALRLRQAKNSLAILLLSQGIPMLLMGDEVGRTQQGNNNAYCHDGPLTWFDWSLLEKHSELHDFTQRMIAFRRQHPSIGYKGHPGHRDAEGRELEVIWHGTRAWSPDWSAGNRVLAYSITLSQTTGFEPQVLDRLYVVLNMHSEPLEFEVPRLSAGQRWHLAVNTALTPPLDAAVPGAELPYDSQFPMRCDGRSVTVLVAK